MDQGFRRGFTAAEKAELWDRWQRGSSALRPALEAENAASTTPKQPTIVSETLDLAQGFPSGQGAPILARGK
jgi:hypothetical protein